MSIDDTPLKAPLRHRFLFVNASILLFLVLGPAFESYTGLRFLLDLFLCLVFLATVRAVATHRKQYLVTVMLVVPFLVLFWVGRHHEWANRLACLVGMAFLGYSILLVLKHVFRSSVVTSSTIYAAVSVYLLVALFWSFIYVLLDSIDGNSFNVPGEDLHLSRLKFVYFSFVTLTTVGYGDITPRTSIAGGLAVIESVVGQIYLVVQVAWLVGMRVSDAAQKKES